MTDAADHVLSHLPPAASRLGAAFARPKVLAVVCLVALAGLSWLYLALLLARMGGTAIPFANAIVDALGGKHINMPATPERVWEALNS